MSEVRVTYPYPYQKVFDTFAGVLPTIGYPLTYWDSATGVIQASANVSLASWGENIVIRLGSAAEDTTEVVVSSDLKFGLVDWGKNNNNINKIFAAMSPYLPVDQPQPPPPPPPPG